MHGCSGNLCTKFHYLSFINNLEKLGVYPIGVSSFLVNLPSLAKDERVYAIAAKSLLSKFASVPSFWNVIYAKLFVK